MVMKKFSTFIKTWTKNRMSPIFKSLKNGLARDNNYYTYFQKLS